MVVSPDERALSGVKVLDLTRFPPGQFCTVLLADLGADVVRVDPPGWDPAMAGVGPGIGRAKRSIAVDLRRPEAQELLRRLCGWADVVVDNSRPGDLDARGFGPKAAMTHDPSLIWCSITGFGQDGPLARLPGHDLTYVGYSGLLAAMNADLPWYPQVTVALPIAAIMATVGITTALYDRQSTGKGVHVDISISESSSWLLGGADGQLTDSAYGIPISASRRLYECADGQWVSVAADEPRTWAALCRGLGLEDMADSRPLDQDGAVRRIESVFRNRPASDWVNDLGPLGTTVTGVHKGASLVEDPHVTARGGVVNVAGSPVPANPIRMNGPLGQRASTVTTPPAVTGAHTTEVLLEAGLSSDEIATMAAIGLFGVDK
jgi:alpha-methylacyl-CoA racemase